MTPLLAVGAGGALGAVARHLLGGWIQKFPAFSNFPAGTLAVNALGCLAIGVLGGLWENGQLASEARRLFLVTGVLGGFTTFSAFGYETTVLLQAGRPVAAALNVLLQLAVGLASVFFGKLISSNF